MIRSRHELKYLVTEGQAHVIASRIRPYMQPDRHSRTGRYEIASLYLDSPDLRLCKESLYGIKNRFKLRVRRYRNSPDAPCFFEIKRRINQVIVKSRAKVPGKTLLPLLTNNLRPNEVSCSNNQALSQFAHYQWEIGAVPLVWVRYIRYAFESRNGDGVRVTLDRQLSFRAFSTHETAIRSWLRVPQHGVILEIKFDREYPLWISRLVQEQELHLQSISKYTRAVGQAGEMRFRAPTGSGDRRHGTTALPSWDNLTLAKHPRIQTVYRGVPNEAFVA